MANNLHWVGTWTTAPAPAESGAFSNQTLRMTINAYGHRPLDIGGACIALRDAGPAIIAGSERKLSFGGEKTATIAAGAVLFSDPVALGVAPLSDLAVSLYQPGEIPNDFQITGRYARQTNTSRRRAISPRCRCCTPAGRSASRSPRRPGSACRASG